jgi:DNA-binding MltR family transcriptional regulator
MELKVTENKVDPLTDWKGFYEEIQNESARGAVIITGAFLDAQLRNLISKSFIDDPKIVDELLGADNKPDRPLSSFSSKIKAAYCMGLISKSMYSDLEAIRKIRNRFAHKMHGYTFDEPEIVNWCKSLKLAKMITDAIPHFPNTHRDMFLLGVTQLVNWLALKTIKIESAGRPILPRDPVLGKVVRAENGDN